MRLSRIKIRSYRSVKDSGWFDVEPTKTILVGPNEAGKSAILKSIEQLQSGPLVKPFDPLRDYPRSEYYKIQSGAVKPEEVTVTEAIFEISDDDKKAIKTISPDYEHCRYVLKQRLDNKTMHELLDAPTLPTIADVKDDLRRLATHVDNEYRTTSTSPDESSLPSTKLDLLLKPLSDPLIVSKEIAEPFTTWVDSVAAPLVSESNELELKRLAKIRSILASPANRDRVLNELFGRRPSFVYFSAYTRVTPLLHLGHLADALAAGAIDERDQYNFGNSCLLKLLNSTARQLSDLGKATEPPPGDTQAFADYRRKLDERDAILNAASLRLTQQIREVWQPNNSHSEERDYTIRIKADQQYLKVVVEDSLGVEVELDQRSEGFQWLVSFFIVFFAQADAQNSNAVLLLDEPGLSLHGLKQREFRTTLSRLAETNQLLFTTHSPFLVGPNELDIVRVVEMENRTDGTIVHTNVMANDPASLLPLQEALGYDLAQSLFMQERNLVLEGLTDYWYIESTAELLREASITALDENIALIPAGSAGKVVYFATILHAHKLKVAALLDSDAAGDQAANQETLVHLLGNKKILRTKDSYRGPVPKVEIEELLRNTLVAIALDKRGWDITAEASAQPNRPIIELFNDKIGSAFSKYHLAKSYIQWSRDHSASDLSSDERDTFVALVDKINRALK